MYPLCYRRHSGQHCQAKFFKMSYPNSYSSCSPIFVDPWQENRQTYLDTTLSDLQSMLDDSAETVVFLSMIVHFTNKNQTVQQQTTLFFTIFGPKNYRYYFIFKKFTLHFSLALGTFSLPVKIGSSLLSHVLLKHNERIIVDTTVSFCMRCIFCIFFNAASCRKLVTDTASP